MKILIIRPPFMDLKTGPPIGLAYMQGALKTAGHRVSVWDMNLDVGQVRDEDIDRDFKVPGTHRVVEDTYERLDEFCADILAQKPDVVGFSLAHNTVDYGIALTRRLSRYVRCIAGGPQASFNETSLLSKGCFKAVVSGYGEEAVLLSLTADGIFSRPLIRGKDYKPDFTGIEIDKYHGFLPILTTRGCPNRCFFCTQHFPYYYHSIESVLDQLRDNGAVNRIHYNDSNININTDRTVRLFSEIARFAPLPHSIVFGFEIRKAYEKYVHLMAKAGVKEVFIGLESGSQRERESMMKPRWSNDLAVAVIRSLTKHKMIVWAQFIFCYPDQTEQDRLQTMDMIRRINEVCDASLVRFQWFRFVIHLGLERNFQEKYGVISTSPKHWKNENYDPEKVEALGEQYKQLVPSNLQLYL